MHPGMDEAGTVRRLDGIRVLVVENDKDTLEFLCHVLAVEGAVFVCVGSGEEALVAIAQAPPEVLLSDISMPDMDGCELVRRVRRLPPQQGGKVPAAAITAHAEGSSVLNVLEAGFDLHVPKPISPDQLVEVVLHLAHRKGA
jgi:CheY-like chemotaxis protein